MANLQIKGMDDQLYKALKRKAQIDHRSVSQEVIILIENFLSSSKDMNHKTEEFINICIEDESFYNSINSRNTKKRFKNNVFD